MFALRRLQAVGYRPVDDIEFFYNPQRKHVGNGTLSPIAFEQQQKLKLQGVWQTRDYSVQSFVEARLDTHTFADIAKEVAETFPPERPASRSSIHRWWPKIGRKGRRSIGCPQTIPKLRQLLSNLLTLADRLNVNTQMGGSGLFRPRRRPPIRGVSCGSR